MATISYTTNDFLNKVTSNGNRYVSNYYKRVREADTGVQDSQDEIADFRKRVRTLMNYDTDNFDTDEVKRNLTSFVKSYNSLKETLTTADNDELNKQLEELEELLDDNSTSLKKLGVKIGDDELTFDEDTYDDLSDKEVKKYADKLFVGSDSFIAKTYKTMRNMKETSEDEEYDIVRRKFYTVTQYSDDEITAATAAKNLKTALGVCADNAADFDTKSNAELQSSLTDFQTYFNQLMSSDDTIKNNSAINSIQNETTEHIEQLETLGMQKDENEDTLSYTPTDTTDKDAYTGLFGETSEYASGMNELCDNTISSVLKADKIGITLDVKV